MADYVLKLRDHSHYFHKNYTCHVKECFGQALLVKETLNNLIQLFILQHHVASYYLKKILL